MIINKNWRILTVGDGDLSFSDALIKHHAPASLTATVYDSLATLSDKYNDHFYQSLKKQNVQVLFEFDICNESSWKNLTKQSFDVVIFQFPLLPAFKSFNEFQQKCSTVNTNTLNRRLLRQFLLNSSNHFLDPNGQQLCYITSKDVAPYRQWNIENSLHLYTDINYLGSIPFDINQFPGYQVRNVDRDKHVKDTNGITYVWSKRQQHPIKEQLQQPKYQGDNYCTACRTGPFTAEKDEIKHQHSNRHLQMMKFEKLWMEELHQDAR